MLAGAARSRCAGVCVWMWAPPPSSAQGDWSAVCPVHRSGRCPQPIPLADGSHIHTPRHADRLAFDHLCQGGAHRGSRIICAARQADPPPGNSWTDWNYKRRKTLPEVTAVCRVRNLLLRTSRDPRQFTSTVHGSWSIKSGKEPRSQHEHAKTNGEVEPFHLRLDDVTSTRHHAFQVLQPTTRNSNRGCEGSNNVCLHRESGPRSPAGPARAFDRRS